MQNERKRILELVEKGTITTQEAITLLEALEKDHNTTQVVIEKKQDEPSNQTDEQGPFYKEQQKDADYSKAFQEDMKDFRKDLTQIGSLFMGMVNTAVKKVKDFDVKTSFGEKYEFQYEPVLQQLPVDLVDINLPNGSVTINPAGDGELKVALDVKAPANNESEEDSRAQILDKIFVINENGRLLISSEMKLTQINVTIALPDASLQTISTRLINGGITLQDLVVEKLYVKTLNGVVKGEKLSFEKAELETSNGAIELRNVKGKDLEAETMNGRVYIDGDLEEVEAKSINGHVIVTTSSTNSSKIDAQTVAGAVEIYVPRHTSLSGKISTNFGKLDVGIMDATKVEQQDQFLSKSIRFDKKVEGSSKLFIEGESKTGFVLVRYTGISESESI